jgi:hypothetical protein
MAEFYPYLVASLPMLQFLMKPPFSSERFLELCCPLIPANDCQVLQTLPQPENYGENGTPLPVIRRWIEFNVALRNELVRVRAAKRHLEPGPFLRQGGRGDTVFAPGGTGTYMTASLLDGEKALDETRWKELDALATGHYFDLEFLIIYAWKLQILERWERIQGADGPGLLQQILQG